MQNFSHQSYHRSHLPGPNDSEPNLPLKVIGEILRSNQLERLLVWEVYLSFMKTCLIRLYKPFPSLRAYQPSHLKIDGTGILQSLPFEFRPIFSFEQLLGLRVPGSSGSSLRTQATRKPTSSPQLGALALQRH